jgi:hypothetical protein
MKKLIIGCLAFTYTFGFGAVVGQLGANADSVAARLEENGKLPPLPAGVTELKFTELYQLPIGPRGLELTDKVRALAGQRVRIFGFMVKQQKPSPGVAIISPFALNTNERDYDLADDLPPSVIFAKILKYEDIAVPFSPRPLLLTGVLEIGRRQEEDGRTSEFRLLVDEPQADPAPSQTTPAPLVESAPSETAPDSASRG